MRIFRHLPLSLAAVLALAGSAQPQESARKAPGGDPAAAPAAALAAALATPVAAPATVPEAGAAWGTFGVQTQWIDPSVKPGDDFDRYVSGKWLARTEIPADRTRADPFMDLNDLSEARLHAILDGLVAVANPPGSDEARIAAAYSAFMNTDAIDAAGLAPAQPFLRAIAAAASPRDLMRLFASPGYSSPLDFGVDADPKASDIYAYQLVQGGLGLPDRDYYLSADPHFVAIRARYLDYLGFMLGKAGYADPTASARAVLALETRMARVTWDRAASRDPDLTYNKLSPARFAALGKPGLMQTFLTTAGAGQAPYIIASQMPPTPAELAAAGITAAQAATKLNGGIPATIALIQTAPVATWRAYLAAHFIGDHAAVLPSDIDAANFAFKGTVLSGQPQQRPRWKRAIGAVQDQLGELLGKIYAARYYPPAEKAEMARLITNLRAALADDLADLAWMSPATRQQALVKLAAFTPKIGAPATFKTYDGLAIAADTPLANTVEAARWKIDFAVGRIARPVDRAEWQMLPQTVNAYYNPVQNEIVFPAAILQPPFFNLSADPAVNYGAIGAVIGHETGHGFDDEGAKFDARGNLRDWWAAQDKANFVALQGRLAKQYDAFCPFDDGRTCVSGKLTMGENIGDLGGLAMAYRAYHISLDGKPAPVIDGFTGDQRFFMAFGQVWRSKIREAQARQYLVSDPHSPARYRVNGIVRNMDAWYQAFDVKPGDALYLPPDQRVKIW